MFRAGFKGAVESLLVQAGIPRIASLVRDGRVLVLAYHGVTPDGAPDGGDRSLHLPAARFQEQLAVLAETCEVVPLQDLLADPAPRPTTHRPRVAITFDDAYQGAVTVGVTELARRGLPATVFVAPAFVGGRSFWWDALAQPGSAGPSETLRTQALTAYRGEDAAVRRWATSTGVPEQPVAPHARAATEDELRAATQHAGITFASHTWSHPNLARLEPEELDHELTRPLVWLRERFDAVRPWLSYPYGLSSAAVERAAARAGYRAAFRITGGWMPKQGGNRFALPRLNVSAGLSLNGFALRLAGLFCR